MAASLPAHNSLCSAASGDFGGLRSAQLHPTAASQAADGEPLACLPPHPVGPMLTGLSTWLTQRKTTPIISDANKQTPILLCHGDFDQVVSQRLTGSQQPQRPLGANLGTGRTCCMPLLMWPLVLLVGLRLERFSGWYAYVLPKRFHSSTDCCWAPGAV